jgi:hypothetical protein
VISEVADIFAGKIMQRDKEASYDLSFGCMILYKNESANVKLETDMLILTKGIRG